jgi:hypothetical protein
MSLPELTSDDITPEEPTRKAPLKWVIVVDAALPPGRAANAAACTAAAVGKALPGLLGPDLEDASGVGHTGLPWAGCSVLGADRGTLRTLRDKAAAKDQMLIVDMPEHAGTSRVYTEFAGMMRDTKSDELDYLAVALVGPRNAVDRLVGRLRLLS